MNRCRVFGLCILLLQGCAPERFFFYPNRLLYNDPDRTGVPYEIVQYPSLNGKKLYGLYFPAVGASKGTVIHFHGNFGNVSNHFPLILFLPKYGFNVLSFDYEGYGASEGRPTAKNLVDDGVASVRYAESRLHDPRKGVVIFGQSLGGAVGIAVMVRVQSVKGAVIESAFSGYRAMGRAVIQRHVVTWPLYLAVPFLGKRYDPIRCVERISPRPVLFIHGDQDKIVPETMSLRLFDKAREPKGLWIVPGAGHLECHRKTGKVYEEKVNTFFTKALQGS